MTSFPYVCPYCGHASTIIDANYSSNSHIFNADNKEQSNLCLTTMATVCPNKDCKEYSLDAYLIRVRHNGATWVHVGETLLSWRLRPLSHAKQFPAYIPKAIIQDYEEACLIRDLSPKASATLARRCLQGMIRDFFGIRKARLIDEIQELEGSVDPLTWQAIDAVRHIGNIGAHMEKDINLIIDVDAEEAAVLIGLIEMLLKEWYVHREERKKRLEGIVSISAKKQEKKKENPQP